MSSTSPPHPALSLLRQAHPLATATAIHTDQVRHRPLLLRPSSPDPSSAPNKRALRRSLRQQRHERQRRLDAARNKAGRASQTPRPRPLSAKEKRALGVHDICAAERRWDIYLGLHGLWCGYMRDVLGVTSEGRAGRLSAETAGPLLATADYHGALMRVVRSGCVSRVGVEGIVVRDTKFTFVLITRRNEIKTIPKEGTVFRFEVPFVGSCVDAVEAPQTEGETSGPETADANKASETKRPRTLVFELHGEQFRITAPDRANKKFKPHYDPNL